MEVARKPSVIINLATLEFSPNVLDLDWLIYWPTDWAKMSDQMVVFALQIDIHVDFEASNDPRN